MSEKALFEDKDKFQRFDRHGIAMSPGESYSVSIKKRPEILCPRKNTGLEDEKPT